MREQLKSARSLKFISIAEAILIAYLLVLFIYLLAHVGQNSEVTITPAFTTGSPAITSPNATQQPASNSASSQAVFGSI